MKSYLGIHIICSFFFCIFAGDVSSQEIYNSFPQEFYSIFPRGVSHLIGYNKKKFKMAGRPRKIYIEAKQKFLAPNREKFFSNYRGILDSIDIESMFQHAEAESIGTHLTKRTLYIDERGNLRIDRNDTKPAFKDQYMGLRIYTYDEKDRVVLIDEKLEGTFRLNKHSTEIFYNEYLKYCSLREGDAQKTCKRVGRLNSKGNSLYVLSFRNWISFDLINSEGKNSLMDSTLLEYDSLDRVSKMINYSKFELKGGQIVEVDTLKLYQTTLNTYDNFNRLIKCITKYPSKPKVNFIEKYEYNKHGDLVLKTRYEEFSDDTNQYTKENTYKYDEYGNWIFKEVFINGKFYKSVKRKFDYRE